MSGFRSLSANADYDRSTGAPMIDGARGFAQHNGRTVRTDERLTDASGEINAGSKSELMNKISAVAMERSSGNIVNGPDADQKKLYAELKAAYKSGDSRQMKIMGEVFTEDLYETMNREGFVPQVFARKDVPDGMDNRIPVRRKDVTAFQMMNDGATIESVIEQPYIYPKDYYLTCMITVEDRELSQRGPELLDEKFQDGLEATMVRQDRVARLLFLATRGIFNAPIAYTSFTPQTASNLITQVASNGLPPANMILAYDVWDDLRADPTFAGYWDPVTKYQLVQEGRLGSLYGVKLITDGFRYQNLKVLLPGEVFLLATPVGLGVRSVRKEVQATEINRYNMGIPQRGWFFEGIESLHCMDRGVASAVRL